MYNLYAAPDEARTSIIHAANYKKHLLYVPANLFSSWSTYHPSTVINVGFVRHVKVFLLSFSRHIFCRARILC